MASIRSRTHDISSTVSSLISTVYCQIRTVGRLHSQLVTPFIVVIARMPSHPSKLNLVTVAQH